MKEIDIGHGLKALVDDDDYPIVSKYKWSRLKQRGRRAIYAQTNIKKDDGTWTTVLLHRLIMNPDQGIIVDHIDGNGLNCTKGNMRLCTHAQNLRNQMHERSGVSKYKGVYWEKGRKKWRASATFKKKSIKLGYYDDEVEAAKAYDKFAKKNYGQFARLNFED